MKTVVLTVLFVIFGGIWAGDSYGQTNDDQSSSKEEIFMQILLRDSSGAVIGYTEGTPQVFYHDEAIRWVEPQSQKSIIEKDGKKFEMLRFDGILTQFENETMGGYFLKLPIFGQTRTILYYHFDSFYVSDGDIAEISWTVLRPIS